MLLTCVTFFVWICKLYQIGDDTTNTRKIATHKYDDDEQLACKITLPVNQSTTGNLRFKFKLFEKKFDMGDWIERWGEKDGNLFVSKMLDLIVTIKLVFESNCWLVKL